MDRYKIKQMILIAFLHLLKFALAALGCFGVVGNLIVIVRAGLGHEEVKSIFSYVKGASDGAIICMAAVGIHIYLLKTMDRYQKYTGNDGPSQLDAFYTRYDRFFPKGELDVELTKMKKNLELMNRVAKAQNQLFGAVCNDKRYACYVDQVIEQSYEAVGDDKRNDTPTESEHQQVRQKSE